MKKSQILGTGSYLPEKILTNHDLERLVETTDEWILERTGISARHVAAPEQAASDLALRASERALESAGLTSHDIDAIIFATVTADHLLPSAACCLQAKLKTRPVVAFDVSAACSGFLYGLSIADQFIRTGTYRNVLVVGAEVLSRIIDYNDRTTCILFGDGAGAVIVGAAPTDSSAAFHGQDMAADGSLGDLLVLPAGGSKLPFSQMVLDERLNFVRMQGREIFKSAVRAMAASCDRSLARAGVSIDRVDWFVPHQANVRIIEAVGDHLRIPAEKVIMNISRTGNTSSASIPLAFDEAVRAGKIKRGQTVLFGAFGGGLTSGSVVFTF